MSTTAPSAAAAHPTPGAADADTAVACSPSALGSDDLALVQRHLWGEPEAFDEIYDRYGEMVFHLALRLSGHRDEAADLTQEIFLRIHRHLRKFRGKSTLKTWIYRVALNLCRSRLRYKRPAGPSLDAVDEEGAPIVGEPADPGRGPESLALAGDEARRLTAALAEVPVKFREAVVLRDLEGLTYREIATVLRVRTGTVRSRIARGRDSLRKILAPAGQEVLP